MFNIGIISTALSDSIRESAATARQLGFAGLLVPAFGATLRIDDLSATGRCEFRHILSAQNQQLIGLSADLGAKGFGPGADVDRLIARLDRVLEATSGLGAPLVCIELGPLPEPSRARKPKPRISKEQAGLILIPNMNDARGVVDSSTPTAPENAPDPAFVAQIDDALIEIGRRADRYSVVVAFRSELSSFAALERALRSADCPWFGVDLDPVSLLRDEWSLDEVFSKFGSLIRHVRARDALCGADKRTRPAAVGNGDTNWPRLLNNLDAAGYRGWITIDPTELPHRVAGAEAARKALQFP